MTGSADGNGGGMAGTARWLGGLVLLVGMVAPPPAGALYLTAETLFERCQARDGALRNTCLGYIMGVVDARNRLPDPDGAPGFCIPLHVLAGELRQRVVEHLIARPEPRARPAAGAVAAALAEGWPCRS